MGGREGWAPGLGGMVWFRYSSLGIVTGMCTGILWLRYTRRERRDTRERRYVAKGMVASLEREGRSWNASAGGCLEVGLVTMKGTSARITYSGDSCGSHDQSQTPHDVMGLNY